MAEELIFPMHLDIDVQNFEQDWRKAEPRLQAILDKRPLKVKLDFDDNRIKSALAQLEKINAFSPKRSTQAAMIKAERTAEAQATAILNKSEGALLLNREKVRAATARADKAEMSLNQSRSKGISTLQSQNKAYLTQSGLLNGMKQFANAYVSILGAYRIGRNIVETTAEFEMQRVALAAIIQNKQEADKIFAQTVELGIQSPFMIRQLITAEKQLAAYRIETENLFDTTKRIADISAGLGVSMERLILAYGQVKAASVLRGQEIRQFTEAGIPIVQLLADKFTKLNGTITSTADVFELVSRRLVPFAMVKEVFEDMTDAGGTFYRMQEIQAETLKGKIANLRDAMDKMFMEIGNQGVDGMKALIDGIRSVMENWETMFNVGQSIIITLGAVKLATAAYSTILGKQATLTIASTMADKKKEASLLRQAAVYRTLSAEEKGRIATVTALTVAEYRALAASGKLSRETILRQVALGRLSKQEARRILLSQAQTTADRKATIAAIASTKSVNVLTLAYGRASAAIRAFSAAIWASTKAMLTNPLTWAFVAAAGLIKLGSSLVNYHKKYKDMAEGVAKISRGLYNEMSDAFKNMSEVIEKGFAEGATEQAMLSARKSLQDILEKNELLKIIISDRLASLTTEAEKLTEIKKIWDQIQNAAGSGVNPMVQALKDSGGVFSKDAEGAAKKLSKSVIGVYKEIETLSKDHYKGISSIRGDFKALDEQLQDGKITLREFSSGLVKLRDKYGISGLFDDAIEKTRIADSKMNRFLLNTLNAIGEINGERIIPFSEKLGLSDENRDELQVLVAAYSKALQEEMGDVPRLVFSLFQFAPMKSDVADFRVVNKDAIAQLSKFSQSYNAFLDEMGIGEVDVQRITIDNEADSKTTKANLKKAIDSDNENLELIERQLQDRKGKTDEYIADLQSQKAAVESKIKSQNLLWTIFFGEAEDVTKPTEQIRKITDDLKIVQDAYKKYLDQIEWFSEEQARANVEGQYGGQGVNLVFSQEGLENAFDEAIQQLESFGKDGADAARAAFLAKMDSSFKEITSEMKDNLEKLAKEVDQTQKANEFYEKMLGLTGSEETAQAITKAMGLTVGSVRESMRSALRDAVGEDVDFKDFGSIQTKIDAMTATEQKKFAQQRLDDLIQYEMSEKESLYKGLEAFMTVEQKKVAIKASTAAKIKKIEDDPNLTEGQKIALKGAAKTEGQQAEAKVDLDALKASKAYVNAFSDLGRVGKTTLTNLRAELEKMSQQTGLSATDLKTINDQIQKIDTEMESANPFALVTSAVEDYITALEDLKIAQETYAEGSEELAEAEDKAAEALDKVSDNATKLESDFNKAAGAISSIIDLSGKIAESLGVTFSDETQEYIDAFALGIEVVSVALGVMAAIAVVGSAALWPLVIVAVALGAAFAGIKWLSNLSQKGINDDLKDLSNTMDGLNKTMKQLARTTDDLIGSDYVKNMQAQIKAAEALRKSEEERLRLLKIKLRDNIHLGLSGQKKIKEEIEESTEAIYDYIDSVNELKKTLTQELTGYTGVADAATSFADSWFNAYLSTEDTFSAMTENFDEMINNMVVKSILAKVVAAKLDPLFAAIDTAYSDDGKLDGGELVDLQQRMSGISSGLDADLTAWMQNLELAGFKPSITQKDKSLTGISASAASMTEDTAITLGGYLNSGLMQWVQQTIIQTKIQNGLADAYTLQQRSMEAINGIKTDTSAMVLSLASILRNQSDTMINGGSKAVNVRLMKN